MEIHYEEIPSLKVDDERLAANQQNQHNYKSKVIGQDLLEVMDFDAV